MDKDYQTVLLEQIRDQNKAILEGQKDQATRADIARIEHRLDALEGDKYNQISVVGCILLG